MGGAFTAIADDTAAVWYNPAGLAGGETIDIFESAQAIRIEDSTGSVASDVTNIFIGGQICKKSAGAGIFYFIPYTIKYWVDYNGALDMNVPWAWGKVSESMQILSIPFGIALYKGKIKIGATLEGVSLSVASSQVFYRDQTAWNGEYTMAREMTHGFSGSIGTLLLPLENELWDFKIQLGAVYRFGSTTTIGKDILNSSRDKEVSRLFFDKPSSYDVGISFTRPIFPNLSQVIFTFQYDITDWGRARYSGPDLKYGRAALGMEYKQHSNFKQIKDFAVRLGYYTAKPTTNDVTWNMLDSKGITFGLGISQSKKLGFDVAVEQKNLTDDFGYDSEATLYSIALTFTI